MIALPINKQVPWRTKTLGKGAASTASVRNTPEFIVIAFNPSLHSPLKNLSKILKYLES
jgi:hypothetical protein